MRAIRPLGRVMSFKEHWLFQASQARSGPSAQLPLEVRWAFQDKLPLYIEADKMKPQSGRLMISVPAQVAGPNIGNAVYTVWNEPPSSLMMSL